MEPEERKILDVLLLISEQTNNIISAFTKYLLVLLVAVIFGFTIMLSWVVTSYNGTIEECTRIYFETDYLYPEQEITQTQTIGDVK